MTQLITIHGVRGFIDKDGTAQLNLEDVSRGLGFTTVATSGNEVIRWSRVQGYLNDFGISTSGERLEFIPENIFYRLSMKAKNEVAEVFQEKVANEILPSIRKTGSYSVEQFKIPTTLTGALRLAADIEDKRLLLEQKIEADKPKTLFAEAVATSQDCILIGQLATMLKQNGVNIGQTRLFNYLREEGYLCKAGDRRNLPTQRSMELRLFEVKEFTIQGNSGIRVKNTPKVTGRGQVYFINKFLNTAS